jgi:hypothetical protein
LFSSNSFDKYEFNYINIFRENINIQENDFDSSDRVISISNESILDNYETKLISFFNSNKTVISSSSTAFNNLDIGDLKV